MVRSQWAALSLWRRPLFVDSGTHPAGPGGNLCELPGRANALWECKKAAGPDKGSGQALARTTGRRRDGAR
jgi:hypothetical protein